MSIEHQPHYSSSNELGEDYQDNVLILALEFINHHETLAAARGAARKACDAAWSDGDRELSKIYLDVIKVI